MKPMHKVVTRLLAFSSLLGLATYAHAAVPLPAHRLPGTPATRAAARTRIGELERTTLTTPPPPGRTAQIARELVQLEDAGRPTLLDLVARLAGESRMDRASERARVALVGGALHALGKQPDDAAVELSKSVLASDERAVIVLDAAATVLGRRAAASDVTVLISIADRGDAVHQAAVLAGLGHARVAPSLQYLSTRIRSGGTALAKVADAAAFAGSSWAWEALGASRAQEGATLRAELSAALIAARPQADAQARIAIDRALQVIDLR